MLSLWEALKSSKGLPAPDGFTALFAKSLTGIVSEISGIPPLNLGKAKDVVDYTLYGNTIQNGSPTPDNPVEVQAAGDRTGNLFNGEIQQGGLGDSNGAIATSSSRVRTTKINVTENAYYTVTSNLMIRNIIAYDNGTFVSKLVGSTSEIAVFSIPVGVNQIAISFKGNEEGTVEITPNDLEWLMLNEGTEPLPYEPYGYKIPVETKGKNLFNFSVTEENGTSPITTTAYIDKPLYKIGDYADSINYAEQKAERFVKELVLTGEENFQTYGSGNTRFFYLSIADARGSAVILSNRYINARIVSTTEAIGIMLNENSIFRIRPDLTSTIDDFKAFLAEQYANGTPVTIYYVLATPETESVTLPKIPTLDGTTVIDVETETEPSNMYIKYKSRR